ALASSEGILPQSFLEFIPIPVTDVKSGQPELIGPWLYNTRLHSARQTEPGSSHCRYGRFIIIAKWICKSRYGPPDKFLASTPALRNLVILGLVSMRW